MLKIAFLSFSLVNLLVFSYYMVKVKKEPIANGGENLKRLPCARGAGTVGD